MDLKKIKMFVYYGAQNYTSLESLRIMVPACYLFMTIMALVAASAGDVIPWGIAMLSVVLIYSGIIYTFHIWCPQPSFACRFVMNGLNVLSLSIIFQLWVYTSLIAGRYINIFDIIIIIVLQVGAAVTYICVTREKIKKGKNLTKKGKASRCNGIIAGGASLGYLVSKIFLRDMDDKIVANVLVAIVVLLSTFLVIVASFHLLKYYYAKKYQIICDEKGNTTSPLLTLPKKKEQSLFKKIFSVIGKIIVLIVLCAVLVGVYQVSR